MADTVPGNVIDTLELNRDSIDLQSMQECMKGNPHDGVSRVVHRS
jgi:hypothetical protein